jgi:hypothetical protein
VPREGPSGGYGGFVCVQTERLPQATARNRSIGLATPLRQRSQEPRASARCRAVDRAIARSPGSSALCVSSFEFRAGCCLRTPTWTDWGGQWCSTTVTKRGWEGRTEGNANNRSVPATQHPNLASASSNACF